MRRRRGMGMRGIVNVRKRTEKIEEVGKKVQDEKISGMKERMQFFKTQLEEFAKKHKKRINKDPEFRHYFSKMCSKIGVDPLASSKGFWAEMLGVGDFYYEIGIQIAQICYARRNTTGGLMELDTVLRILLERRKGEKISVEDVHRAVDKMKVLGNGFCIVRISGMEFIQSVPFELSEDNAEILDHVKDKGHKGYSYEVIRAGLGWNSIERVRTAMMLLQKEGMAWVDSQTKSGVDEYWFPGLFER